MVVLGHKNDLFHLPGSQALFLVNLLFVLICFAVSFGRVHTRQKDFENWTKQTYLVQLPSHYRKRHPGARPRTLYKSVGTTFKKTKNEAVCRVEH
ncbi:hypothetical protein OUZ56_004778 [Daphnia magna]|uniref:Uncharacterized protein n=1 Tax=Daphnia magna TaxID=35525 RepID=A0ABQ9YQU5_9CRUS|nr:hypothetical protein OUZ56_004778 [Daphnia magna]